MLWSAIDRRDAAGVQQAIRNGADVNCVGERNDRTVSPLLWACECGLDDIVRILLDAGADARWKDLFGRSAITMACWGGHLSVVEMLLNHDNGLLEIADQLGGTPLIVAIGTQHFEIVRYLLDRGANALATMTDGLTTLLYACQSAAGMDILRRLLTAGVNVEARDEVQGTALHCVAIHGGIEVMRELIVEHNADMFAVDKYGETPFDVVCRTDHQPGRFADLLFEIYSNKMTADHGRLALHEILKVADYSFIETEEFHPPSNPPLQMRVPLGTLTVERWCTFLQSLDTELIWNRDDMGKLPLHIACRTNTPVKVLSLLVDLDSATLQIADHSGNLPLHNCCFGAVDSLSVRYLVEQAGVGTLAARNHQGLLPLHVLCGSTNPPLRTIQYMIQSFPGSVAARTNNGGQYPIMIAARDASLSVVYELVRANPDLLDSKR